MTRNGTRAFWPGHVEAWRAGGESQAAYCGRHDLSAVSFSHWERRFEREQLTSSVGSGDRGGAAVVEVQIANPEPSAASAGVTVDVGARVRLELARDFDAAAL